MSEKKEFYIAAGSDPRNVMVTVWNLVCSAIAGGALIVTVMRESKSRAQEKKFHAMIGDIANQVRVFGKQYSAEIWKALLVDSFEQDKRESGEPLTHPGRLVPSMDGGRLVSIRPSTTKFRKTEAVEFIEFLYCQGNEMGVAWSEPALLAYREYADEIKAMREAA